MKKIKSKSKSKWSLREVDYERFIETAAAVTVCHILMHTVVDPDTIRTDGIMTEDQTTRIQMSLNNLQSEISVVEAKAKEKFRSVQATIRPKDRDDLIMSLLVNIVMDCLCHAATIVGEERCGSDLGNVVTWTEQ
jgi:hypothetical protein